MEDVFGYSETKDKYATEKIMKRKGFKEAIVQIESALSGEDPSPLLVSTFQMEWIHRDQIANLLFTISYQC